MHRQLCLAAILILTSSVVTDAAPPEDDHTNPSWYRTASGEKQPVTTSEHWAVRRQEIVTRMQEVMGPLPDRTKWPEAQVRVLERKELDGGLVRQKIQFVTDSADRPVKAWVFLPAETAKVPERRAAILCLHQTIGIGKDEPAGLGGSANLHYAIELAQHGFVTLAPDYPSFGEYPYTFPPEHGYISGSMKAISDNMRAIDVLQAMDTVDPERIGCIGHSLGGHNTMFTAVFDTRVKALVSSCGFTRFHKYYGGSSRAGPARATCPGSPACITTTPMKCRSTFPRSWLRSLPARFWPARRCEMTTSKSRGSAIRSRRLSRSISCSVLSRLCRRRTRNVPTTFRQQRGRWRTSSFRNHSEVIDHRFGHFPGGTPQAVQISFGISELLFARFATSAKNRSLCGKKCRNRTPVGMTGAVLGTHNCRSGRGFRLRKPVRERTPMPAAILKVLALSGVISAGCFAVWKANSELAPADSAQSEQFTPLPGEADDTIGLGGEPISKPQGKDATPADDQALAQFEFAQDGSEEEPAPSREMPPAFPAIEQSEPDLDPQPTASDPEPGVASLDLLEEEEARNARQPSRIQGASAEVGAAPTSPAVKQLPTRADAPILLPTPTATAQAGAPRTRTPSRVVPANAEDIDTAAGQDNGPILPGNLIPEDIEPAASDAASSLPEIRSRGSIPQANKGAGMQINPARARGSSIPTHDTNTATEEPVEENPFPALNSAPGPDLSGQQEPSRRKRSRIRSLPAHGLLQQPRFPRHPPNRNPSPSRRRCRKRQHPIHPLSSALLRDDNPHGHRRSIIRSEKLSSPGPNRSNHRFLSGTSPRIC